MPILPPVLGTPVLGTLATTSVTLDFAAAAVGDLLVAAIGLADAQASPPTAPAGWTFVQGSDGVSGGQSSRTILGWRTKQSGDTTQQFSWPTSCKHTSAPLWYPGAATVESSGYLVHASGANYVSPPVTPANSGRWVLVLANPRSTTAIRTVTPDGALVERADTCQGGTNPWPTVALADSGGPVTVAAHTYTAVASGAESHGGTAVAVLAPVTVARSAATSSANTGSAPNAVSTYTSAASITTGRTSDTNVTRR